MPKGSAWLVPVGVTSAMVGRDPHPYAKLSARAPSFVTCKVNVAPAGSPSGHAALASPAAASLVPPSAGALVPSAGPASLDDEVPDTVPPHAAQASMSGISRLSV